jgi:ureidoacrylate peracid hydrolase
MIPNVNRISAAIRSAGGLNVFLRYTYDEAEQQPWVSWYRTYMAPEVSAAFKDAFSRGAEPWQLWPLLEVEDRDLIIEKTRFSGFIPGTCRLDEVLRARGVETVIITGTSPTFAANQLRAMQCNTEAEHNATLCNMTMLFADVMTTAEVVAVIEASKISEASQPRRSA